MLLFFLIEWYWYFYYDLVLNVHGESEFCYVHYLEQIMKFSQ